MMSFSGLVAALRFHNSTTCLLESFQESGGAVVGRAHGGSARELPGGG